MADLNFDDDFTESMSEEEEQMVIENTHSSSSVKDIIFGNLRTAFVKFQSALKYFWIPTIVLAGLSQSNATIIDVIYPFYSSQAQEEEEKLQQQLQQQQQQNV